MEEEELQPFKFNYVPTWQKGTTTVDEEEEEEENVNEVIKGNTLIDASELNEKSEETLIQEETNRESYIKAIEEGKGEIDTKTRSTIGFGLEYAPEELRGQMHWRNSIGDALRLIDRAGIGFAQNLFNTTENLMRADMPASLAELLTGDFVSSTKMLLKATKEGIKERSFAEFFEELGYGEFSENKMSFRDASLSTDGQVNNFKMFDAISAEDQAKGVDYGLFGLPSLTELSGGYPERDTGRWFADGVTNFLGDSLPFFTVAAAAMAEPTPSAEVVIASKTLAKLKATSPAFRSFYNLVSRQILTGKVGTTTKLVTKFIAKESIKGAGASAIAEFAVGNPYRDGLEVLDAVLPDWLDYSTRVEDGYFSAKIKSMIVSELFLGPLFGTGVGVLGKSTKGFREPVITAFSRRFKDGDKQAFNDLATQTIEGIQRTANKFRGKNRFNIQYNYLKEQFKPYVDEAEGDMVEATVNYIFDTTMVRKVLESMDLTYKTLDQVNKEIENIKVTDTKVDNIKVDSPAVTRDTQLNLEKDKIRDQVRKDNVEGREKTTIYEELQNEKQKNEKLQAALQKKEELEKELERKKNAFTKTIRNSADSEKKLTEKVIINANIRPSEDITAATKVGIGAGANAKSPLQITSMNPNDIVIRPDVFQIKESGKFNPKGVSGSLADETEFDPRFADVISVWKDESGELGVRGQVYVIDGHNRIDLAKRSNMNEVNVQIINALDVEDAKAEAAIINVNKLNYSQQGAIAPIDVAKVIKNRGIEPLLRMGMNPKRKIVMQGRQLARLPDFMFTKLIAGEIGLEKGLAYGSQKISPTAIGDVFKAIDKSKPSLDTIREAVLMAREAVEVQPSGGQALLPTFGEYFKETNTKQLLAIRSQIRTQLRKKLTTLRNVGTLDKKAGVETVAGNKINLENTQDALQDASRAVDLFDAVAASGGETTQIIKELADQLKIKGKTANKLVNDNLDRIQDAMQLESTPLFKGSELVDISQQIDKETSDQLEGLVQEKNTVTYNDKEIEGLRNEPKFKEVIESVDENQQESILDQLKTKGKVTNNPSSISGTAIPPLVSNPKARVFPHLFEETLDVKPRDSILAERLQSKETVGQLSNFELEDAVRKTEKYYLTNKQIKNIQAKRSKFEKAEAIEKELDRQIDDMLNGKGEQGKLFETDPNRAETVYEKLLAARDKAREEAAKYVDGRLELHNGHVNARNELENRKRNPQKYNEKEQELVSETEATIKKEQKELKATIDERKQIGSYKTKKGYNLDEAHKIDNFTFVQYMSELDGMVDKQGKPYSRFYFGNPKPRFNNEVIEFISDLDIAIYTVAKQIANGTSRKSKSHYKYVELLEDLGLTNNQIMTRYKEIIADLKAGNLTIEPPEQYYSSKLLKVISDFDRGMTDIAGRYEYNIEPEDIISERVNRQKKALDEKINKEYQDINNPKKPDEFGAEQRDYAIEDEGGDLAGEEIHLALSGTTRSEIQGLMQEIEKISGIDFKLVAEPIEATHGYKSAAQYGVPVGSKIRARGFYRAGQDPLKDIIVVSMIHGQDYASFSALAQTAYHEAFHRLFQRYFTKSEHALLKSAEPTLRRLAALIKPKMHDKIFGLNGSNKLGFEEIVAISGSSYKQVREIYEGKAGKWEKVFEKISDMVTRVKNFLTGKGFKTWKDLFDDSIDGKIAARGMTPEGAKFRNNPVEETNFDADADELSNLFAENLEALNEGAISLEQMMSNVRRPLVNRKYQKTGSKFFIPTTNKSFIAANKAINQAMDKMNSAVLAENSGFPELPSIHLKEIARMAKQLIEEVDGDSSKVLALFKKAQQGDVVAQKDFTQFMAVKFMRDAQNDMFSMAAVNYKNSPTPQNSQLLVAAFEDSARLNDAYAKYGRVSGQRMRMMGREVEFRGEQIKLNIMPEDSGIKLTGDPKSLQNAMEKGLQEVDEGLGKGAYFTSGDAPIESPVDDSLLGSLKGTDIIDLVDAGISVKEILAEMKVNVNFKNTLSKYQKEAINTFIKRNGADGIRIRGVDLGRPDDIIYIPDVKRANSVIGSKAEMIPASEVPTEFSRENFENALANGQMKLKNVLDKETYESIFNGKPTPEARELIKVLSDIDIYITDKEHGSKILRHINKGLDEMADSGFIGGESVVNFFRNSIFLGIPTFVRVMAGTSLRARLMPFNKQIGAKITQLNPNLNQTERGMAHVRSALQGFNAQAMADSQLGYAIYLARMAFKHDMNFGNIGRGQFELDVQGAKKVKRFAVEEQTDLPIDYKPSRRITEQPRGDEWWLNPNKSMLKLFMHRVGSIAGNFSSRTFSSLDTLISTGTVIAQENIRHAENILLDMYLKGIDITDSKVIHEAITQGKELTRKTMVDVQMANGDVVKGGFFDSEYMRDTADYLAFTDDINVKRKKRTREYALRRAKEKGITDPLETIDFVDNYLALGDPVTNRKNTKLANEMLPAGAQESVPLGSGSVPLAGDRLTSLQTSPTNLLSQGIALGTRYVPPLGIMFPVNRTPLNILKGLARSLPVSNRFVDSYWRDINSEDLFTRENAIGEMVIGGMTVMAGTGLIASGAIEVTGGYGANQQKRQMMLDQRRPAWSIRFRTFDGDYTEWVSLEAFDTFGTLLSISATYKDILERMPIEQFTSMNYDDALVTTSYEEIDVDSKLQQIQDISIVASAQILRHLQALKGTLLSTATGQLDKSLFKPLNDIYMIVNELQAGDGVMKNYTMGKRNVFESFLLKKLQGFNPQFIRQFRQGMDNRRVVSPHSDVPIWGVVENIFREMGEGIPFISDNYEPEVDELIGEPKIYSTPFQYESIKNPVLRGFMAMLNPLSAFRPTQERDYGFEGTIYSELNRLHGAGAYPRFIDRNILGNTNRPLDDAEFNKFKLIFAKEVKFDYFGIGKDMNVSEALYYLITTHTPYQISRDIDPSLVGTSIAQGYKYPERISTERKLTKLQMIYELIEKYRGLAKDIYIEKYMRGNETALNNSLNELSGRNLANADRNSLPVYGASVNLNAWREIINS